MSQCSVSVILITYNRLSYLRRCLDSVQKAKEKANVELDLRIAINGNDELTRSYLSENGYEFLFYEKSFPVGEARNKLIETASGEFLCFIDDDVEVPDDYFIKAFNILKDKQTDVFGGPDQSPKNRSRFQEALNNVMRSFWAMGPTKYRHTEHADKLIADESNLILCNLWMRKEAFVKYKFPKDYIRNEENILLGKLKKDSYSMRYINDLIVYHNRKENFQSLARATYFSGYYRMRGFFDVPETFSWYYLVPMCALIIFIVLPFISIKYFIIANGIYFIFIFLNSIKLNYKNISLLQVIFSMGIFITYNFTYGAGMLCSLIKGGKWKR